MTKMCASLNQNYITYSPQKTEAGQPVRTALWKQAEIVREREVASVTIFLYVYCGM